MEQGTVSRTTASTNMNATSSRSHMVITISFAQVQYHTHNIFVIVLNWNSILPFTYTITLPSVNGVR